MTFPILDSPAALREALARVASNLSFSWRPEARALFAAWGEERFAALGHNPVALLAELSEDELAQALTPDLADRVRHVLELRSAELTGPTWWDRDHAAERDFLVAYFSLEFGLDESMPIYSGGLGVLAGDHLKSASELGLPLVGVGLFYRRGYFRQDLDPSGRQTEWYPDNDPSRLPVSLVRHAEGLPVVVTVDLVDGDGREVPVRVQVFRVQVGRISLYLLDTCVDGNPQWARDLTDALYGGDREHRIRQELVLGVGGVRALRALGLEPTVFHMNEGHSAFLQLERMRELVDEQGLDRGEALGCIRAATVFTTHTPVPAGNEIFDHGLVQRNVWPLARRCGFADWDEFDALGRVGDDWGFGLTPFALRTAARANAVSALHGEVSRELWRRMWPDRPVEDVPIGSITNGVHSRTWLSAELGRLLGHEQGSPTPAFERVRVIEDGALWQAHLAAKHRLATFARGRVERRGGSFALDPDALTIGFARRFATYKRAWLLFRDPDRLARLLNDLDRPLQVVLAGKAHPADEGGKDVMQRVVEFGRDPRSGGRVVFLEDYEMTLARHLVQGVDVWLNTPRRPHEASGTSGMKAALNGVLNCSILDGWWVEGYSPERGFAIGDDRVDPDEEAQDAADAESLFAILEQQVVPAYYERDERGLPTRWLPMMRASIAELGPAFSTTRMVREYAEELYLPAHERRNGDLVENAA